MKLTRILIAIFMIIVISIFVTLASCAPESSTTYSDTQYDDHSVVLSQEVTVDGISVTTIKFTKHRTVYRIVDSRYNIVCYIDYDAAMQCSPIAGR